MTSMAYLKMDEEHLHLAFVMHRLKIVQIYFTFNVKSIYSRSSISGLRETLD